MRLWQRLRYLLPAYRDADEREMHEELESLAHMAEPGELGSLALAADQRRDAWGWAWLEQWTRDVRHAARMLRRNPMFTLVAAMTLAIGIGANALIFSVINSVLLNPLRYPQSEELVAIRRMAPGAPGLASFTDGLRLSPSMYFTYAEHNRTFQSLGVWVTGTASVTGLSEPERVRTVSISDGVLQALSVPPVAGRWLSKADQVSSGRDPGSFFVRRSTTVMLTYGYWQRRFGGDLAVVGRSLTVDSRPREIVGVMPRGFQVVNAEADLIVPLAFDRGTTILAGFAFQGIGRLKPDVTVAQANAEVARLVRVWMDSWTNGPGSNGRIYETWRITPAIRPLKQQVVGNVTDVLWVVMATIGLVLLIACANVTNLLLVRTESRQQELAVRAALGAGRGRIVRSLLVESVMLGLMGGVLGVGLAGAGVRLLVAIGPANLPRLSEISLGTRVLGFRVPGVADCRARIYPCGASADLADLHTSHARGRA
jgi:predicted permease